MADYLKYNKNWWWNKTKTSKGGSPKTHELVLSMSKKGYKLKETFTNNFRRVSYMHPPKKP